MMNAILCVVERFVIGLGFVGVGIGGLMLIFFLFDTFVAKKLPVPDFIKDIIPYILLVGLALALIFCCYAAGTEIAADLGLCRMEK